ncbi:MAG: efflux RND transporter periplasmic adaptor subunit [Thermodesulfobacteriota bacterium]
MFVFANFKACWVASIVTIILFGCGPQRSSFVAPPPPDVTVSAPLKQEVTDYLEFTGNTKAIEEVEIRARVQGFLDSMNFQPGQKVKAGDVLFVIDPKPFQTRVHQQAATLKAKEAAHALAKVKADKSEQLFKTQSVSELSMLEEIAHRDVALAQVGVANADLEEAQLQLDYTQVKSPITGNVSRNLVDLGSLVGAQEKTLLTTVVNDSSIYAYFNLSENDLLRISRTFGVEKDKPHRPDVPCFLARADDTDFPHKGQLDFVDTQVDPNTGTLQLRAVFPNDKNMLFAGLFVRVRVPLAKREALLVPNLAVGLDQGGRYVLVVKKDNLVEQRPVEIGQQVDRLRVIEKGISAEDLVIINGMQRARPGAKVNPSTASASATPGQKSPAAK